MTEVVVDRSKFVGGSDIASILGIAPKNWRSIVDVWAEKRKDLLPDYYRPETGANVKRRGKRWEGVVGEMLCERLTEMGYNVGILGYNQRFTDPDVPYFACEIDFQVTLDREPVDVELKTVHPYKTSEWGESGTDEVPIWYLAQVMWGQGIRRRNRSIIAPLFGADEIRVYEVNADPELIATMRERASAFWTNNVLAGVPPEAASLEDIAKIFPKDLEQTIQAGDDMVQALLRLRAVEAEIKARSAERDSLEFMVRKVMGSATAVARGDKVLATCKERPWSVLDQARLKSEHAKLHKELMRHGTTRVFALKSFDQEDL